MAGLALLAALVVGVGCVVAAGASDRRLAVVGVTLALVAAPLVALQQPDLLSLGFREVAALIGAYVLWAVTRAGARVPWTGLPTYAAVFTGIAFAAGLLLAPGLGVARGPAPALAASAAAASAAIGLTIGSGAVFAAGLGATLVVLCAVLAVAGLTGTIAPLDHAIAGAALLAVTTAAAFLGASDARPAVEPPAA